MHTRTRWHPPRHRPDARPHQPRTAAACGVGRLARIGRRITLAATPCQLDRRPRVSYGGCVPTVACPCPRRTRRGPGLQPYLDCIVVDLSKHAPAEAVPKA